MNSTFTVASATIARAEGDPLKAAIVTFTEPFSEDALADIPAHIQGLEGLAEAVGNEASVVLVHLPDSLTDEQRDEIVDQVYNAADHNVIDSAYFVAGEGETASKYIAYNGDGDLTEDEEIAQSDVTLDEAVAEEATTDPVAEETAPASAPAAEPGAEAPTETEPKEE